MNTNFRNFLISLYSIAFGLNLCHSQTFYWAKKIGGGGVDCGYKLAKDYSGNIYMTGECGAAVDLYPGPGTVLTTGDGAFFSKTDPSGNLIWGKSIRGYGEYSVVGNAITVDYLGNVIITGFFGNTVDFDPDTTSYFVSGAAWSVFVLKLDPNGNFKWVKTWSGGGYGNYGYSVASDTHGNIYTTGLYLNNCDFDPGPSTYTLNGSSGGHCFISKLDSSGNFIWARDLAGGSSIGESLKLDNSGNIYVTGFLNGSVDLDVDAGTNIVNSPDGSAFVLKLNQNGNSLWAKHFDGGVSGYGGAEGYDIILDANNNIFATGAFYGPTNFDPGLSNYTLTSVSYDTYVIKLDAAGNFVWVKSFGGNNVEKGYSIALDMQNNIYITGGTASTDFDFDPGPATFSLSAQNGHIFLSILNSQGNFVWGGQMGGHYGDIGRSIIIDNSNNIYTTGQLCGPGNYNPYNGTFTLTTSGWYDLYFVKLSPLVTLLKEQYISSSVFNIFPNPAVENAFIEFEMKESSSVLITVQNATGQLVQCKELNGHPGKQIIEFDLNDFTRGCYFVSISNKEGTLTKKILLE
jgi:hypothetical protein